MALFIWLIIFLSKPCTRCHPPASENLSEEQKESLQKAKERWQAKKEKLHQSSPLKSFNLSYEKRKEIYINFTEDPSYDLLNGYSKEMDNYRFEKYTKRYNISEGDILRILTEGLQKGW